MLELRTDIVSLHESDVSSCVNKMAKTNIKRT